ncbi:MAG: T9SS type A sorting domain-containing protein, partial [Bacteroidota bacterium]
DRKIYLDGELIATDQPIGHAVPTANNLTIGLTNESEVFNGNIDEVRVWNIARSAEQIIQNKDKEISPNEPGLMAYFRMNEGKPGRDNRNRDRFIDLANENNFGFLNNTDNVGCISNWEIGAPIQLADINLNGVADVCELVTDTEELLEETNIAQLNLFPNPSRGMLNILFSIARDQEVSLEVINLEGKLIYEDTKRFQEGDNLSQLNLQHIPSGFYFLKLIPESGEHLSSTFIKQ